MILRKEKSLNAGPIYGTGEGVAHSKRWYVALVRMHHEKKVSEHLDKMGIENFDSTNIWDLSFSESGILSSISMPSIPASIIMLLIRSSASVVVVNVYLFHFINKILS